MALAEWLVLNTVLGVHLSDSELQTQSTLLSLLVQE